MAKQDMSELGFGKESSDNEISVEENRNGRINEWRIPILDVVMTIGSTVRTEVRLSSLPVLLRDYHVRLQERRGYLLTMWPLWIVCNFWAIFTPVSKFYNVV